MTALRELLRNPIYRGELVWNRSEWIKDHETGKRRRFERPEAEWLRRQDEAIRIVSDATWERAQAVMQRKAGSFVRGGAPAERGRGHSRDRARAGA